MFFSYSVPPLCEMYIGTPEIQNPEVLIAKQANADDSALHLIII